MIIYIVNHNIHGIDRTKKSLHARTRANFCAIALDRMD